ncbi:MAG: hypothetical protein ACHQ0Y_06390 [Thermodesulfovibrionales bacterium]
MLEILSELSKSDAALLKLLGKAREYADLYLIAKKRQKGCDGLGEMTNLKDEFREAIEELLEYCRQQKRCLSINDSFSIDSLADEFENNEIISNEPPS